MRELKTAYFILLQTISLMSFSGFSQRVYDPNVVFSVDDEKALCFDAAQVRAWKVDYQTFINLEGGNEIVPVLSIQPNKMGSVNALISKKRFKTSLIKFRRSGTSEYLGFTLLESKTKGRIFQVILPSSEDNYSLEVLYGKDIIIGKLDVRVYPERIEEIVVVPLMASEIDPGVLVKFLDKVFAAPNIRFNINIDSLFDDPIFREIAAFNNPSLEYKQYTEQMQSLRDAYFRRFPNGYRNANYIFIIPEFKNKSIQEYNVRGKSIGFVANRSDKALLFHSIAQLLAIGIGELDVTWKNEGPARNSTDNLLDERRGVSLNAKQWDGLNASSQSYSYYDDYEQVYADNGMVAYFFWEEDEKENIRLWDNDLMTSIRHPFKRNFQSYHLDIDEYLFQTLFTIRGTNYCLWHLIFITVSMMLAILLKKRLDRMIDNRFQRRLFLKFFVRLLGLAMGIGILYAGFFYIESKYQKFEVKEGEISELKGMTEFQAIREIRDNNHLMRRNERSQCAEVFVHRGNKWLKSKHKRVLYFDVHESNDTLVNCRFVRTSDSLIVPMKYYKMPAKTHYIVFNYRSNKGGLLKQRVFNYKGSEITNLLNIEDPSKRILLFVNGYRSVVNDRDINKVFSEVQKKGLEMTRSSNLIHSFDRFDYWYRFDDAMVDRINPSEKYYADGNFSITTSNYRTLDKFVRLSGTYPSRCADEKHHTCTALSNSAKWANLFHADHTLESLRMKSNRRGFKIRYRNGKIAGLNMLQMLNEEPNKSKNDTIYIAAHSMGYAYALGIIEVLRGAINFGGFYIIAPENAGAGRVYLSEWPEVWQYGANLNRGSEDAPCIQDGIAPQTGALGLSEKNRIYIPEKLNAKRGFKASHFIGLYTFLFDIPKDRKGHVQQH